MADDDPVASVLRASPLSPSQRHDLWEVYYNAPDLDTLENVLKSTQAPSEVKHKLWDLKSNETPTATGTPSVTPEASAAPPQPPRGVMGTAMDLGIGAAKGAGRSLLGLGEAIRRPTNPLTGEPPMVSDAALQQAHEALQYQNTAQRVGGGLETVAEIAMPVRAAARALPSATRASAAFQDVMGAAKHIPVNVNAPGQVAFRVQELAEHGGSMPMAVRKFLGYVTDPNKPAMTYEVARDFASNISRLSANEYQRLTPVVAREVAHLRVTLNKAVADAAGQAGKGAEYAQAMTEYARAMKIRSAIDSVVEGAKRTAPYATAAGAGYWLTTKLKNLIGDQ